MSPAILTIVVSGTGVNPSQRPVVARYDLYRRRVQVLEPSTQGFLSIVEKQFPQTELYLFELLQNSVDDGASEVAFRLREKPSPALEFSHNVRTLRPLPPSSRRPSRADRTAENPVL